MGQFRLARIDDDQTRTLLELLQGEACDLSFLAGGKNVAGPGENEPGRVVEIGHRIKPAGVDAGDLPRGMADVLRGDDIG